MSPSRKPSTSAPASSKSAKASSGSIARGRRSQKSQKTSNGEADDPLYIDEGAESDSSVRSDLSISLRSKNQSRTSSQTLRDAKTQQASHTYSDPASKDDSPPNTRLRAKITFSKSSSINMPESSTRSARSKQTGIYGIAGTGRMVTMDDSDRAQPNGTDSEAWAMVEELKEKNRKLKEQLKTAWKVRSEVERKKVHWKDKYYDKCIEQGAEKTKKKDLPAQLKQALEQNETLTAKFDQQDAIIRKWQDKSVGKARGDFPYDTDDVVASNIEALFRSVKGWASKYAVSEWHAADQNGLQAVLETLEDESKPAIASPKAITAILTGRISPKIVTMAIMNRNLVSATLSSHVSILTDDELLSDTNGSADLLKHIFHVLSLASPAATSMFRCTVMTAVKPDEVGIDNIVRSKELSKRFEKQARRLAEETMNAVASLLVVKDQHAPKAEADLASIAGKFISTAIALHAQPPHTFAGFQEHLRAAHFDIPHELMDPHPLLNLSAAKGQAGDTPADAGVLGQCPDLIIQPLVSRTGDNLGQSSDEERTITKALVWMCRPGGLEEVTMSPKHPKTSAPPRPVRQQVPDYAFVGTTSEQTKATGCGLGGRQLLENVSGRDHDSGGEGQQTNVSVVVSRQAEKRSREDDVSSSAKKARIDHSPESSSRRSASSESPLSEVSALTAETATSTAQQLSYPAERSPEI
ncbi:uncharacterized protein AB675_8906 [Cyphellophora attinorum]|uniref:Uncharacterized protein n=1 Tax=Cyphellophora attinorum TaxID=1664694 RepID=A0A0N1H3G7_9EURO|nr:uncharacterized protein AB675_8906 [Phialophora attinorum]KPI36124.1 hypothetical protein AB675_8906 [Phialophora attinorum]